MRTAKLSDLVVHALTRHGGCCPFLLLFGNHEGHRVLEVASRIDLVLTGVVWLLTSDPVLSAVLDFREVGALLGLVLLVRVVVV